MKNEHMIPERVCPFCNNAYTAYPALSRRDNQTEICPECGTREALIEIGVPASEIDKIIGLAKSYAEQNEAAHEEPKEPPQELSEAARQARNAYYREQRKKHPERKREQNRRYWERRALREAGLLK